MLYLYLGFLLGQSLPVFKTLYNAGLPPLAVAFAITVFLSWTFVPTLGYLGAKLIGAQPRYKGITLFVLGIAVCMQERLLFHLDILTTSDGYLPFIISAVTFFIIAYIPSNKFLPYNKADGLSRNPDIESF